MSLILQDELEVFAKLHQLDLQDLLLEIDYSVDDVDEFNTDLNIFRNGKLIFTISYSTYTSSKGSNNSVKILNNVKRYYIEEEIK